MQIWQEGEEEGCCGLSAVEDARRVARLLDIPYYVLNFKQEFQKAVMDYFAREYLSGRTPNPCIACNRYVKWEALLDRARVLGADYIATGHYARIEKCANGRYAVKNSVTSGKDQTYALYRLTQEQLRHTLMPVGSYTKEQIRELAEKLGLPVAGKRDSQEICFIPDKDYAGFIERYTGNPHAGREILSRSRERSWADIRESPIIPSASAGDWDWPMGRRGLCEGRFRPRTNEVVIGEGEEVFSDSLEAGPV